MSVIDQFLALDGRDIEKHNGWTNIILGVRPSPRKPKYKAKRWRNGIKKIAGTNKQQVAMDHLK